MERKIEKWTGIVTKRINPSTQGWVTASYQDRLARGVEITNAVADLKKPLVSRLDPELRADIETLSFGGDSCPLRHPSLI